MGQIALPFLTFLILTSILTITYGRPRCDEEELGGTEDAKGTRDAKDETTFSDDTTQDSWYSEDSEDTETNENEDYEINTRDYETSSEYDYEHIYKNEYDNEYEYINEDDYNEKEFADEDNKTDKNEKITEVGDFTEEDVSEEEIYTDRSIDSESSNQHDVDTDESTSETVEELKTYEEKREFLRKNKYEHVKSGKKRIIFEKTFHFKLTSESVYNFVSYCHRSNSEPENYEQAYNSCVKKHSKSGKSKISDEMYELYESEIRVSEEDSVKEKNGKGKHTDETDESTSETVEELKTYKEKCEFLRKNKYEHVKSGKKRIIFEKTFRFNLTSESVYNFVSYCHRFDSEPGNYEKAYNNCVNKHSKSGKSKISHDMYELYVSEIQTNRKGYCKGNKCRDDDDNSVKGDSHETYRNKYKFLQNLDYKDCKSEKTLSDIKAMFKFELKSKSELDFLKHCYRHKSKPKNHDSAFYTCLNEYKKSRNPEVSRKLCDKYDKEINKHNQPKKGLLR